MRSSLRLLTTLALAACAGPGLELASDAPGISDDPGSDGHAWYPAVHPAVLSQKDQDQVVRGL